MLKRFFSNQSRSITAAAIVLGAASLVSRLLGLIRDRVLAHYFGAGPVMDSYYAAFKIPDLLYTLSIIGALSAGLIPIFTKIYLQSGEDKKEAWKLISNTINILAVALAAISFILIFDNSPKNFFLSLISLTRAIVRWLMNLFSGSDKLPQGSRSRRNNPDP